MENQKQPARIPDYTIVYIKDGKICSHVIKEAINNEPLFEFIDANGINQEDAFHFMGAKHLFPMSQLWRDSDDVYDPDAPPPEVDNIFPTVRRHNPNERVTNARDIGVF